MGFGVRWFPPRTGLGGSFFNVLDRMNIRTA